MKLTSDSGELLGNNTSTFYADDLGDPTLVNVIEIRVVIW